ncbi:TPA: hypothetical protein N0F65_010918 [Lagenidium giganteum]|uniref:Uncharacterized protein n=1 Tax=Lagenidium giganteum TaxID=4803 RepID=A0AAV2YWK5_9STRA|nr:TPA: hypothetical protein N0F65_010918 [Lagenidium giganteum]
MTNVALIVVFIFLALVILAAVAYGARAWKQYREAMQQALNRRRDRDAERSNQPRHSEDYWTDVENASEHLRVQQYKYKSKTNTNSNNRTVDKHGNKHVMFGSVDVV